MRNIKNAPSRIKYHLSATYGQRMGEGHLLARASRRSSQGIGALILAFLALTVPAFGQGSVMPSPVFHGFTLNGTPLVGGKLCTFEAGTTTPADTFPTSALTPGSEHANPVILNARGEETIFLTPGQSYKFVLMTPGSDQTCATGSVLWSVDGVSAVPTSNVNLDIDGTAGESIAAGDMVYMSNGLGGTTAGLWYLTDSDNTLKSTGATQVGIAPVAIATAARGTIRQAGVVAVTGPISTGADYFAAATPGAISATAPTNAIRIGSALSPTSLLVGNISAPVSPRGPPCGRLTLTTGVPITTADVTAATTIYYSPYGGCNQISLSNGSAWRDYAFTQVSIAVPATTNTNYDVFAYDNLGVIALELAAWSTSTVGAGARFASGPYATLLPKQNDVYVKSTDGTAIDATRLYLGSFSTTGVSGQTEDSVTKRYVWNNYHRVLRPMRVLEGTASWVYVTAAYRQANAAVTNQLDFIVGVAGVMVQGTVDAAASSDAVGPSFVAIGEDSTSVPTTGNTGGAISAALGNTGVVRMVANLVRYPAVGRHIWVWLERGNSSSTTWQGTANGQSAIWGWIEG